MKTITIHPSRIRGSLMSLLTFLCLCTEGRAATTLPDSLATAVGDSVAQDAGAMSPRVHEFDVWARGTGQALPMAGRRPATLADALRGHSSIRLRESGDPGARLF